MPKKINYKKIKYIYPTRIKINEIYNIIKKVLAVRKNKKKSFFSKYKPPKKQFVYYYDNKIDEDLCYITLSEYQKQYDKKALINLKKHFSFLINYFKINLSKRFKTVNSYFHYLRSHKSPLIYNNSVSSKKMILNIFNILLKKKKINKSNLFIIDKKKICTLLRSWSILQSRLNYKYLTNNTIYLNKCVKYTKKKNSIFYSKRKNEYKSFTNQLTHTISLKDKSDLYDSLMNKNSSDEVIKYIRNTKYEFYIKRPIKKTLKNYFLLPGKKGYYIKKFIKKKYFWILSTNKLYKKYFFFTVCSNKKPLLKQFKSKYSFYNYITNKKLYSYYFYLSSDNILIHPSYVKFIKNNFYNIYKNTIDNLLYYKLNSKNKLIKTSKYYLKFKGIFFNQRTSVPFKKIVLDKKKNIFYYNKFIENMTDVSFSENKQNSLLWNNIISFINHSNLDIKYLKRIKNNKNRSKLFLPSTYKNKKLDEGLREFIKINHKFLKNSHNININKVDVHRYNKENKPNYKANYNNKWTHNYSDHRSHNTNRKHNNPHYKAHYKAHNNPHYKAHNNAHYKQHNNNAHYKQYRTNNNPHYKAHNNPHYKQHRTNNNPHYKQHNNNAHYKQHRTNNNPHYKAHNNAHNNAHYKQHNNNAHYKQHNNPHYKQHNNAHYKQHNNPHYRSYNHNKGTVHHYNKYDKSNNFHNNLNHNKNNGINKWSKNKNYKNNNHFFKNPYYKNNRNYSTFKPNISQKINILEEKDIISKKIEDFKELYDEETSFKNKYFLRKHLRYLNSLKDLKKYKLESETYNTINNFYTDKIYNPPKKFVFRYKTFEERAKELSKKKKGTYTLQIDNYNSIYHKKKTKHLFCFFKIYSLHFLNRLLFFFIILNDNKFFLNNYRIPFTTIKNIDLLKYLKYFNLIKKTFLNNNKVHLKKNNNYFFLNELCYYLIRYIVFVKKILHLKSIFFKDIIKVIKNYFFFRVSSYYLFNKTKHSYLSNLLFHFYNSKTTNNFLVNIKNRLSFKKKIYSSHYLYDNSSTKTNLYFLYYYKKYVHLSDVLLHNVFHIPFLTKEYKNLNFLDHLFFINTSKIRDTFFKRLKNLIFYYKKSFFKWYWLIKKTLFNLFYKLLYIIKHYILLLLKKLHNTKVFLYLFKKTITLLLNKRVINNFYKYTNTIVSYYDKFLKKQYYKNYFLDLILYYLIKNKSFYTYYMKYYSISFLYLFYYIELTISHYTKNNCFLFINYSLKWNYYLNSAKLWCEYIAFFLKKKMSIWKLFFFIKRQQQLEKNKMAYHKFSKNTDFIVLHPFKYPLKGIRIIYSGNLKKARRKRKLYYYVWLSNSKFTGKMPLKKFKFFIDYYSTSVTLKRSNVGIKFWLLFNII